MRAGFEKISNSFGKNKKAWVLGGALTALTTIWGANEIMKTEPTPEEQATLTEIAQLDKAHVKQTVTNCVKSQYYKPSRGAELALSEIHEAYKDDPAQEVKVKKSLLDNKVALHSTATLPDDVYGVFRNDGNGGRSLIVQVGVFSDYNEQLADLLNQIMEGDLLEKPNITSVIRYDGDSDYKGVHTIAYSGEFDDFKIGKGDIGVFKSVWKSACVKEKAFNDDLVNSLERALKEKGVNGQCSNDGTSKISCSYEISEPN